MFTEEQSRPVLAKVCGLLGRPVAEAVLLRHHTNAVYAVAGVVVKIAPPAITFDCLRTVVDLVQWLVERGFPTVALVADLPQPIEVDGYPVTVWERLDAGVDRPVTTGELGRLLNDLHALARPPIKLATLDPRAGIRRSIAASRILPPSDQNVLVRRLGVLSEVWTTGMPLGVGLVQSDPQVRNALRRADGTPVLADWDGACIGPRIWDVATVAVHCRRFGAGHAFTDFLAAYGRDPREWEHFEDLCRLRELQMIATNARKAEPGSAAAAEVHRRVAGLRRGRRELTAWSIL
ncbi:phosphotransferase enzyme family protein [Actinoplanes sp. L3-i22]|uniref:phosphotransferase enzyme family protein n=1 Tax=Actinoplanes sp. L3-i22 TaxID=2836373 RepID=UPI001C771A66|nr:phosphotransferase [Actinoplanes sp. L3-i22]BCY09651.1 aminoglycoside phosphotransferase [Actinoplanes sp. L3-i22]